MGKVAPGKRLAGILPIDCAVREVKEEVELENLNNFVPFKIDLSHNLALIEKTKKIYD